MDSKFAAIEITLINTGLEHGELTSAKIIPTKKGLTCGIDFINCGRGSFINSNKLNDIIMIISPTPILISARYCENTAKARLPKAPRAVKTTTTPRTN